LNNDRSIFLVCNALYGQIVVALPRNLILTDENIKIYRYKLNSETASLRTLRHSEAMDDACIIEH
jgi:hypothetical protein